MDDEREAWARSEFEELHEHIRQRDGAMVNVLTVTTVASLSLFSATAGFLATHDPLAGPTLPALVVLLVPLLFVLPAFAVLTALRQDIYRMGTYLSLFHEERARGFGWHIFLLEFRNKAPGESLDHVPMVLWLISALSTGAYWLALFEAAHPAQPGFTAWALPIPLLVLLWRQHGAFMLAKDPGPPLEAWRRVKEGGDAPSGEGKLVRPEGQGDTAPLAQGSEAPSDGAT